MSALTPREVQLIEIRQRIAARREDAAECRRRAVASQRQADEHLAEAAESEEAARRWEVVHDAVRFGVVPNLDGCVGPDTGEVPF